MNRVGVSGSQRRVSNMAGRLSQRFHHGRRVGSDSSEVNLIVKYFLFLFNFILWLASMAMVGLMSWLIYEKQKPIKSAVDFFFDPVNLLCLCACIAVVVTAFGWMGALREIRCCISIYSALVMVFLVLEVVVIIFIFVFYYVPDVITQMGLYPEDLLKNAIVKYREDEDLQNLIDSMQKDLVCCGTSNSDKGYLDWNDNVYFNCSDTNKSPERCAVPYSCCKIAAGQEINYLCGGGALRQSDPSLLTKINTNGCLRGLRVFLESNALVIGGVIIGILVPQGILACCGNNLNGQIKAQMSKW